MKRWPALAPRLAPMVALAVIVASGVLLGVRAGDRETFVSVPKITAPEVPIREVPPPDRTFNVAAGGGSRPYATSSECPEMDNPGGLEWEPSDDPGPFPTDGRSVIPSLGVDAPIVKVRVNRSGEMAVPHNARDVAWLDQGGIPGETKNVVLAGHINYSGVQGSFARIRELAKGDVIVVAMNDKHYKFRVAWNCYFDRNTDHAAQIMGRTDVPSVTLISCGGTFNHAARTHNQRIAVRAEMYSPPPPTPKPPAPQKAKPTPTPAGLLDGLRR